VIDIGSLLAVFARNEMVRSTPDVECRLAEIVGA